LPKVSGVGPQQPQNIDQFVADFQQVDLRLGGRNWLFLNCAMVGQAIAQLVAGAADGEALLIKQFPDAPDPQPCVTRTLPPVATPLSRLPRAAVLLPVAQHMRLDATQFADFAYREIALGRNGRQFDQFWLAVTLCHGQSVRRRE
jgi:hypothetical protein